MQAIIRSKQCFRCGTYLHDWMDAGSVTISGFVNNKESAYYNQFFLCENCHTYLLAEINKVLYPVDEED